MSATPFAPTLTVELDGHPLVLCAERAAFDPVSKLLLVADAHFGKDAVFRSHGIPVPVGSTAGDLARLDALIAAHDPQRLVFLGDVLHGAQSHTPEVMAALHAWRARHREMRITIVEGNHDRHAGLPPASLDYEAATEPWRVGPWALCHYPQRVADAYALAGHEHPVYRLATRIESVRLPCFRFNERAGVLPAFGSFTGGYVVNDSALDESIYVIADGNVLAVK
ncbi:ligase-associated DNA damage response endonuclease PdeM [Paraburkholderia sp. DHOC27]|uniref:ligase-associated DNA damage response endonuclease PdeM n=1 Tax=Paraburkholderia sp. DHOC27 TaxID=2303330 RepID=UPI000E3DEC0E|nr:ligase-associated DNA damage response endonuclease PdeM [Paraburkholderia sp. DHOC27]RFU44061.1 ligase-associated DNA damage response endonuclease PdeM [Paraburkholderia sp. DHOC27]